MLIMLVLVVLRISLKSLQFGAKKRTKAIHADELKNTYSIDSHSPYHIDALGTSSGFLPEGDRATGELCAKKRTLIAIAKPI